jgi:hypothetical protein
MCCRLPRIHRWRWTRLSLPKIERSCWIRSTSCGRLANTPCLPGGLQPCTPLPFPFVSRLVRNALPDCSPSPRTTSVARWGCTATTQNRSQRGVIILDSEEVGVLSKAGYPPFLYVYFVTCLHQTAPSPSALSPKGRGDDFSRPPQAIFGNPKTCVSFNRSQGGLRKNDKDLA